MRKRALAAALAVTLGLACSPAPPPVPTSPPHATASASAGAPPAPDPFRVVVIDSRSPSPVAGVEWARLQPEGRTVSLLSADAGGGRKIAGAALFPGPSGRFAARSEDGTLDLFEGTQRTASLGKLRRAAFDAKGDVLAWGEGEWAAFDAKGAKVRGAPLFESTAALLPSGILVERTASSLTRVVELPSSELLSTGYDCQHFFPGARRAVCLEVALGALDRPTRFLHVMSLATGEDLRRTTASMASADLPIYGISADGARLAWAWEDVVALDVASGKRTVLRQLSLALPPSSATSRVAFATDGQHVCVEGQATVHILPPIAPRPGKAAACLFAQRRDAQWASAGLVATGEWDGVLVTFPVTRGFAPISPIRSSGLDIQSQAISRDLRTAAVLERTRNDKEPAPRKVTFQALVLDVATGAVRRTVHLADYLETYRGEDSMAVALSDDGKALTLCAPALFPGSVSCAAFDTESGEHLPVPLLAGDEGKSSDALPPKWSEPHAAAALQALGAASGPDSRRVLSFHDEGAYVSADIGTAAGVELHVNVPDAPDRTVTDIEVAPDASFLAVAGEGAVDLWSFQPLAIRASLITVGPSAWVALFPDGSFELLGGEKARESVACEREGALFPAASCAAKERPAGTLRALFGSRAAR